jgi:uncharacterized membrane protein YsdA (DUF1294 family)
LISGYFEGSFAFYGLDKRKNISFLWEIEIKILLKILKISEKGLLRI